MKDVSLPWATYLLSLTQAINLTVAVISVTITAVIGGSLAPIPALATVPYGVQFASVMLFTFPASMLMQRFGRKIIFIIGAGFLIIAGLTGFAALQINSFAIFIAASLLLGVYIACANFYRFAAVDNLPVAKKPRGVSMVVAGGVIAAIIGPLLASSLSNIAGFPDFAICYIAMSCLGIISIILLVIWPAGNMGKKALPTNINIGKLSLPIAAAIIASSIAYLIMNLLMVESSMVLKQFVTFSTGAKAIQAHVIAMFLPSFITGHLIEKYGIKTILMIGFSLIIGCAIFGMFTPNYYLVIANLVLLGLGWNFCFIAGGALLTKVVDEKSRYRWQGISDSVVAICATIGAFLPAPMIYLVGWQYSNALVAFLCIACMAICWRALINIREV